ncbi:tropinone reductase homolog At5g06060-like isoform X2 [Curcuma longa]|uniref:tropinone reductase homolog At5g06060-like isoform X2 n=1 Tax=Curcuma longa TaxID=136217 RepID=UPI003D9F57C0
MGEVTGGAGASRATARWTLQGTTALVTGGTRGIGHAVVEEFARLGASVHTCSRKEDELAECLSKWAALGFRVTGSVCDLSVREQRERLIRDVSAAFDGKLNILVNNAGTNVRKPTVDYSAEEFSLVMATNLESAYHLCQLAHSLLKASGVGSIVFISSVAGVVALNTGSVYAATKAYRRQRFRPKDSRSNATGTTRRAGGSIVPGGVPLPACCFIHNRTDNFCRWRNDRERL